MISSLIYPLLRLDLHFCCCFCYSFLSRVRLFFILVLGYLVEALFSKRLHSSLDLANWLNINSIICIFYCFFFYIQSSPPIFAPSPPSLTHSFAYFFLVLVSLGQAEDSVLLFCFYPYSPKFEVMFWPRLDFALFVELICLRCGWGGIGEGPMFLLPRMLWTWFFIRGTPAIIHLIYPWSKILLQSIPNRLYIALIPLRIRLLPGDAHTFQFFDFCLSKLEKG